jgi:hypothetical protein
VIVAAEVLTLCPKAFSSDSNISKEKQEKISCGSQGWKLTFPCSFCCIIHFLSPFKFLNSNNTRLKSNKNKSAQKKKNILKTRKVLMKSQRFG